MEFSDPALFQAMAMSRGVDISDMASVDVIYTNKVRPVHTGTSPDSPYPKATSRIMGLSFTCFAIYNRNIW